MLVLFIASFSFPDAGSAGGIPETGNKANLIPSNSPTSEATATAFSHEVSQSVPQSSLSPVLAKYKKYLQSCYNARVLAPADKYLPTLESPYINLAMIRRGRYNHEQRDEFTRRTLHGGVDQILENKTPINIEDLLTPEHRDESYQMRVEGGDWLIHEGRGWHTDFSGEFSVTQRAVSQTAEGSKGRVRFILVEGPPGIGKSTFAWEVCRRWDEIESLRDYHTVVLLKLREKWVLNATLLSDIFRYEYDPNTSNCISIEFAKTQGSNLLLVLDGFDEVSHSFHENSVIKRILCRQLLPECTIILTTRPVAMYTLRSICQPQIDKHVEIIGFTEEERVRYINEVFSKEPELQVNFLKYMFLVPHIKSMMYIPLNCAIIAQVYYESQSSHHLAIPRTRTQLYKALTHSLLVRHMKIKDSNCEYTSMLPEGLDEENMKNFKTLAKFAFDSYHKGESRKVTFFKEDIPQGLVYFGFMNESTEMYAGKGVEKTFSFLHLSLQEYLAAWHLADSYSIEFQVAYHRLAVEPHSYLWMDSHKEKPKLYYKGDKKEEEALISSLPKQKMSLEEPAIFLAGITGWRCQSEDDRNHWEIYLSHDTVGRVNASVLLRSFYEAQNPTLLPHYFTDSRRKFFIGSLEKEMYHEKLKINLTLHTPYDCYALSYCLANSSDKLCYFLTFGFNNDNDISLVETFVKGLNDHSKFTIPGIKYLEIKESSSSLVNRGLLWLMRSNFLAAVEESVLHTSIINISGFQKFVLSLINLQLLTIGTSSSTDAYKRATSYADLNHFSAVPITSWEWLFALKSLSDLKVLHICSGFECSSYECNPPTTDTLCWMIEHRLTKVILDINIEFGLHRHYDLGSPIDVLVDSVLKSILRSNQITNIVLPDISHETMAGIHNILLHCPSLTTLELKRTRLGYDGILYICKTLRNNTTLRHLVIHDRLKLSPFSDCVTFPVKSICTNLLLELSNIIKDNTLKRLNIQSDSFYTGGHSEETVFGLKLYQISSDVAFDVLQTLIKLQSLKNVRYCKWLASPESFKHLQELHISNQSESGLELNIQSRRGSEVNIFYIEFPTTAITSDQSTTVDKKVNLVLQLVLKLNTFSKISLSDISRETMAGVYNILLHYTSLTTLELKRTRLGYGGILYICSALRNNTTLRHLVIHNHLLPQPSRKCAISPGEMTPNDLLLELSHIVKENTLSVMDIKSDSLSSGVEGIIVFDLKFYNISSDIGHDVLKALVKIQSPNTTLYCDWLALPESLKHLQELHISNKSTTKSTKSHADWIPVRAYSQNVSSKYKAALHIEFPSTTETADLCHLIVDLVLQFTIVNLVLSNVSCETMVGVHNILLHCPCLTTLELKRTRLGYDGILYICSALRSNTTLRHLEIHNHLSPPPSRKCVILPGDVTPNDLLLELSHIVKENTLSVMDITSSDSLSSDEKGLIFDLKFYNISSDIAHGVLTALVKIQSTNTALYCDWLALPESIKHLQELHISNKSTTKSTKSHAGWIPVRAYSQNVSSKYKAALHIEFPSTTETADLCHLVVDLVLQFTIVNLVLSNVSCETMVGVHNILLHCPSLTTLELKRTRLGYNGILYICSALRSNTTLRHLEIHNHLSPPPSRKCATLPSDVTPNDLLQELSHIVKENTLSLMNITSSDSLSSDEKGVIFDLKFYNISSDIAHDVLTALVKIQSTNTALYCDWLALPESIKHLQELHISNKSTKRRAGWIPVRAYSQNLANSLKYKAALHIEFPSNTKTADLCNSVVHLVLQFTIVNVVLSNVTRESMASVHNILLHCPCLTTLELKRTRLGYDGILYICSTLRNNTTLRHLGIHDDLQLPPFRKRRNMLEFTSFSSMERVPLPGKTTCTDFLLELNNILKDNITLEVMKIQSGLFLPLSAGIYGKYCQWTGLGPLQQFNVGAVGSCMSPNLRRSFSSSDLTQPQTTLFWERYLPCVYDSEPKQEVKLFSKRKEMGKKLFSLPSFTAPDTEVLQSFSGLDPRLKECLEISHLHRDVGVLGSTYQGMLEHIFNCLD